MHEVSLLDDSWSDYASRLGPRPVASSVHKFPVLSSYRAAALHFAGVHNLRLLHPAHNLFATARDTCRNTCHWLEGSSHADGPMLAPSAAGHLRIDYRLR